MLNILLSLNFNQVHNSCRLYNALYAERFKPTTREIRNKSEIISLIHEQHVSGTNYYQWYVLIVISTHEHAIQTEDQLENNGKVLRAAHHIKPSQ